MKTSLLVLFSVLATSKAVVEFTHSTLYDIHSFTGVATLPIPQCDNGCVIFASTMGDTFAQTPDGQDPYARNLVIRNDADGVKQTITALASRRDNNRRKIPLTFQGPAKVSVANSNAPGDMFYDIVVYVVDLKTASALTYSVYDALYLREGGSIFPESGELVTIMSAYSFTLDAFFKQTPSTLSLWLAGFDNAGDANVDECPYAYKSPKADKFGGFKLETDGPMATFDVLVSDGLQIAVGLDYTASLDVTSAGFATSPGYNGCLKPRKGGVQSWRSRDAHQNGIFAWNTEERYNMRMEVVPHLDAAHKISIYDEFSKDPKVITGTAEVDLTWEKANYFNVYFSGMAGDQGFLIRYAATLAEPSPTSTKPPATLSSGVSSTVQSAQPTTSGSAAAVVSGLALMYCFLLALI